MVQARAALGRRRRQPQPRLCRRARGGDRRARGRDRQGEIAAGIRGSSSSPAPPTLARSDTASQQALDQAQNDAASARADVAEAEANHAAAVAGPTKEERAIADAQVKAAAAALAVLERQLDKTILRAPADGIVSVIVAEVGENVRAGQPVLAIEATGKQWLSFNAREDLLHGLTVGATVDVARPGAREPTPAVVTELLPLGSFATWQAERAVGDHDRNTLRLRLDPQGDATGFEPGMTVWLNR